MTKEPHFSALVPFFVFVVFYLGLSIAANDFYRVPMIIAFIIASAFSFFMSRNETVNKKMEIFAQGMGELNIMIMCMIFILAGIFASLASGMKAVDSAVNIARHLIPANYMIVGFFLISSFLSMAIGTSCGTITCLVPIAMGLVKSLGISPEMMLGAVVGGAMFGDNLSMISDTTIAATRTQCVEMKDKFYTNVKIILPGAVLCVLFYILRGNGNNAMEQMALPAIQIVDYLRVLPYIAILVLALVGMNVMMLLFLGIILAGIIGICCGSVTFWDCLDFAGKGALGMAETLIIALLAGGLLHIIRYNGGIAYIMQAIRKAVKTPRDCELGVFILVSLVNLFTANNTVAIVIAGPLAKELSDHYGCSGKRIAAILDTASCFVQGIIPYGAQVLIAVSLAKAADFTVSSWGLLANLYYPYLMALLVLGSIIFGNKKKINSDSQKDSTC